MSKTSEKESVPVVVKMRRLMTVDIPAVPALPNLLVVRRAQVEDAQALTELLGQAFINEVWETAGTKREFFCDKTVKATWMVDAGGQIVATASLQIRTQTMGVGHVRWVATDAHWRRRGLARTLLSHTISFAKKLGCQEIRLQTTSDLTGAITLYLQLGFKPVIAERPDTRCMGTVVQSAWSS